MTKPPTPQATPSLLGVPVLCVLGDGDLITLQWSGQLRTVAVMISLRGVALRDLTEDEMAQLVEEATRAAEESDR